MTAVALGEAVKRGNCSNTSVYNLRTSATISEASRLAATTADRSRHLVWSGISQKWVADCEITAYQFSGQSFQVTEVIGRHRIRDGFDRVQSLKLALNGTKVWKWATIHDTGLLGFCCGWMPVDLTEYRPVIWLYRRPRKAQESRMVHSIICSVSPCVASACWNGTAA